MNNNESVNDKEMKMHDNFGSLFSNKIFYQNFEANSKSFKYKITVN